MLIINLWRVYMHTKTSIGIYKDNGEFSLVGTKYNFIPLIKASSYIDPVWEELKDEAKMMVVYTAKKEIYGFEIRCVEYHPQRSTLVHFKGTYSNGRYTEGVVPIEKNEASFIDLLKDIQTSVKSGPFVV
jgi:hypothetical protein